MIDVVPTPGASNTEDSGPEVLGGIGMLGVKTGVPVVMVLERLGGATLFCHSVVPLMTE